VKVINFYRSVKYPSQVLMAKAFPKHFSSLPSLWTISDQLAPKKITKNSNHFGTLIVISKTLISLRLRRYRGVFLQHLSKICYTHYTPCNRLQPPRYTRFSFLDFWLAGVTKFLVDPFIDKRLNSLYKLRN
jgi:hypothetical protein